MQNRIEKGWDMSKGLKALRHSKMVLVQRMGMVEFYTVPKAAAPLSIINECTTDCGENVGGSSNPAPAQADSDDGDGDGDGDPDSEPPHRTRKPRSTPRAAASCGTADLSDPLALSVVEFCERHRITKPTFYELVKRGTAPRIMKVGRRTLISIEAAADWRRQMEQGAQLSRRSA